MLLCSASAAATKQSISACERCLDGLVLAIGDLRLFEGSPQREDCIPDLDGAGKHVLPHPTANPMVSTRHSAKMTGAHQTDGKGLMVAGSYLMSDRIDCFPPRTFAVPVRT